MKRHAAEGLDIVIIRNMRIDVSVQIIYRAYDYYRQVYYNDTIFANVQVEKQQHQLQEFLQIHVRPFKHLNNLHMLSKHSGFSVKT